MMMMMMMVVEVELRARCFISTSHTRRAKQ